MNKIKKSYVSIITASILIVSNANAASTFWDDDSILHNFTAPASATDSNTGITYLSGGGLEVRFKTGTSFPPLAHLRGPSVSKSCSGISFDAGYASFMNLEKLGKQLSQSGASVAYGVLLGLVYSMPGIEQVFARINEWSEWLQGLMNDSCAIGTNIGKRMAGNFWKDAEGIVTEITNGIPSPSDVLEKSPNWQKTLKFIYTDGTSDDAVGSNNIVLNSLIGDTKGGLVSIYLNTLYAKSIESISFSSGDSIEVKNLSAMGLKTSTEMMVYLLMSLTSTLGVDEGQMLEIGNAIKDKESEVLSKLLESKTDENTFKKPMAKLQASAKDLISFLLNGGEGSKFAKFKEPRIVMIQIDDKKGSKEQFMLLSDELSTKTNNSFKDWEGYIQESKKLVTYLYNYSIIRFYENGPTANNIPLTSIKLSLFNPRVIELIQSMVISENNKSQMTLSERQISGGSPEAREVLNYLAYQNAIQHTELAIDNINTVVDRHTSEINKRVNNSATEKDAIYILEDSVLEDLSNAKKNIKDAIFELKEVLSEHESELIRNKRVRDLIEKFKDTNVNSTITGGARK